MLKFLKNKKAQSVAEYVIILGLVVATVVAMQTYVKRGVQGRIRDAVDFVDQGQQATGEGATAENAVVQFNGSQYEPYYLRSDISSTQTTNEQETYSTGGSVGRTLTSEETETTGNKIYDLGTADND
jgi:Flp pilus assembly pilin Flp